MDGIGEIENRANCSKCNFSEVRKNDILWTLCDRDIPYLIEQIKQISAERDAAVAELKYLGDCVVCKHNSANCPFEDNGHEKCFEWRGPLSTIPETP